MIKKKLFNLIIMGLMTAFLLSPALAKEEAVSEWIDTPVKIDGSEQDWAEESLIHFKKFNVDYSFKNNGNYLFSVFIFRDPEYLSSIRQTGMTLWLNPEGKKKKHYGIRFQQLILPAEKYIQLLESQQGSLTEQQKQQIRSKKQYSVPNIFIVDKDGEATRAAAESKAAVFRTAQYQDRVVYEFAVPIARPTDTSFGIGAQPGQSVKAAFEWGGMTEQMKQDRLSRMGQMSTRAGSSAGNVGDVRGERRVRSGSSSLAALRRNAPKQYCLWVDVALAENK